MKEYNGHRSWNCWNVSLWLFNDAGLYRLMLATVRVCVKRGKTLLQTVHILKYRLPVSTPDGGKFNLRAIREAIKNTYTEEKEKTP